MFKEEIENVKEYLNDTDKFRIRRKKQRIIYNGRTLEID